MSKFKSVILILGLLAVCAAASLATFFALSFSGVLVSDPIAVVFEVASEVKSYDGTPLTPARYSISEGELVNGHKPEVRYIGSQTTAGESLGSAEVKILDENGFDVTGEYAVKVNPGLLVVEKQPIMAYLNGGEVVYSGNKVIFDDYTVLSGSLASGHRLGAAAADNAIITAGDVLTRDNALPAVYDSAGRNVSENYEILFGLGEAKVVPRPLAVKPVGAEKVYDGKPLTCSDYKIVSGSLAEGHYAEVSFRANDGGAASVISVGEVTAFASVTVRDIDGVDVTRNYAINQSQGATLRVTKRDLTLTAKSCSWEYDGAAHSLAEESQPLSALGLVFGETVTVTYGGTITDVGEVKSTFAEVEYSSQEANYNVTYIDGTLSVTPAKFDVTIKEITKNYGEEVKPQDIVFEGLPDTGFNLVTNASIILQSFKDAGVYTYNVTESSLTLKGEAMPPKNYTLNIGAGLLTINKRNITLKLKEDLSKVYDGLPFAFGQGDLSAEGLLPGHNLSSFTNDKNTVGVTKSPQVCAVTSVIIADEFGKDVTRNYEYTLPQTNVKVTERTFTFITDSAEKEYDGTPLTATGFKAEGLADGDRIVITKPAETTEAGEPQDNEPEYDILNSYDISVIQNYNPNNSNIKYGTLTVTPKKVQVAINGEREFNGEKLTVNDLNYVAVPDVTGLSITDSNLVGIVNAGTYKAATAQFEINDVGKLSNYEITVTGEYTILPKPVTVTVGNLEGKQRVYNGSPLTLEEISVACDELPNLKITESNLTQVKDAGTYNNITAEFSHESENLNNYAITVTGEFTVTQRNITLTYGGATQKVYDGTPFKVDCSLIETGFAGLKVTSVDYTNLIFPCNAQLTLNSPVFALNGEKVSANNFSVKELIINVTVSKKKIVLPEKNLVFNEGSDIDGYLDEIVLPDYIQSLNAQLVSGDKFDEPFEVFEIYFDSNGAFGNDLIFAVRSNNTIKISNTEREVTDCYDFAIGDGIIGQVTIIPKSATAEGD